MPDAASKSLMSRKSGRVSFTWPKRVLAVVLSLRIVTPVPECALIGMLGSWRLSRVLRFRMGRSRGHPMIGEVREGLRGQRTHLNESADPLFSLLVILSLIFF